MKPKTTNRDTVIEEIHAIREAISDKFDGNISAIQEDARKRQAASGRPTWQGAQPTAGEPEALAPGDTDATPLRSGR